MNFFTCEVIFVLLANLEHKLKSWFLCTNMVDFHVKLMYIATSIITLGLAVAFIHHPRIFAKTVVSFLSGGTHQASPHDFNVS